MEWIIWVLAGLYFVGNIAIVLLLSQIDKMGTLEKIIYFFFGAIIMILVLLGQKFDK